MMQLLSIAILLLSCHSSSSRNDKRQQIDALHIRGTKNTHSSKGEDEDMLTEYLEMPWLWDEDENDPPGPNEGWPHTEPFHMTVDGQKTTNEQLDKEMIKRQIDEMIHIGEMNQNSQGRGINNLPFVHTTQIARPEGSDTAYYTGVTHFHHVNNPNHVTLLFSAGRHDGGSNTFVTIDTSNPGANPFEAAQELFIDEKDVSTYTWVSSYTSTASRSKVQQRRQSGVSFNTTIPTTSSITSIEPSESLSKNNIEPSLSSPSYHPSARPSSQLTSIPSSSPSSGPSLHPTSNPSFLLSEAPSSQSTTAENTSTLPTSDTVEDESVIHFALFSGGSGDGVVGLSKMYAFEEDSNGELRDPQLVWVEEETRRSSRYCLLADLGNIYNGDKLVSKKDIPDIIISGTGGLDIYSNIGSDWKRIRSLPLVNEATSKNPTGAASYVGVVSWLDRYLVISSRSKWKLADEKQMPNSPCVLYDYQNDKVVQEFSPNAQTISVDVVGDSSEMILGSGGNPFFSGQPNLLFEVATDDMSLNLSDAQLFEGMPTSYSKFKSADPTPTIPEEYFAVIGSGLTKTRQVMSFSLFDLDVILEVNSAQPCNIYARYRYNNPTHSHKILPLPGSEGYIDKKYGSVHARGGDMLVIHDKVYVVLANFNGNNRVHSFDSQWLIEE